MRMLYFLTEHTLIIYVQYIKDSKRKTSYLLEKLFEKDLVHFVSESIFKRLNFDYLSSETVSNQKIKINNYFLDDCVFLEFRLTHGNQLLPNITKNKWVTAFSIREKKSQFYTFISTNKPDIIVGTETWLTAEIHDNEYFPPELGYTVYRRDRSGQKGGGVIILVNSKFTI